MKIYRVFFKGEYFPVLVDKEDAVRVDAALKLGQQRGGGNRLSYAPAWKNRGFRPCLWFNGKNTYLSRFILGLLDPAVSHLTVDHIDQNPLNNQRSNLRVVSKRTNSLNSVAKREQVTSSKYKGVCWSNPNQRWQAWVMIPRPGLKSRMISRFFKTEEEAYHCRLAMETKYYAEDK